MKFYAIKKGHKPGIYTSWPEAKKQVMGFSGAVYKSFTTKSEAEAFMSNQRVTSGQVNLDDFTAIIYTDGGSRNTGNVKAGHIKQTDKAAWAYLIQTKDQKFSDSAGEFGATNNKMEIMALISALQRLKDLGLNQKKLLFVLDSQYVLNAITNGWLAGWKKLGWRRSGGELKNKELWQTMDQLLTYFPQASWEWTKGHANNRGNIFVDELLNTTMDHM